MVVFHCYVSLPEGNTNIQSNSFIDGSSSRGCFKWLGGSLGPQCCFAAKCYGRLLFCQVVPLPVYMILYVYIPYIVTTS